MQACCLVADKNGTVKIQIASFTFHPGVSHVAKDLLSWGYRYTGDIGLKDVRRRYSGLPSRIPFKPKDVGGMTGGVDLLFDAGLQHVIRNESSNVEPVDTDPGGGEPADRTFTLWFRWFADRGNVPACTDRGPHPFPWGNAGPVGRRRTP